MRSRLEAKWAAFFDLVGWRWDYEPRDFDGWIPDFVLYGADLVYVEVKPVVERPVKVCEKIDASGCEKEVLIVGMRNPIGLETTWSDPGLGWLRENVSIPDGSPTGQEERVSTVWWGGAAYGRWKSGNGMLGFCHEEGIYIDRISGGYDGGSFGATSVEIAEIKDLWAKAHNRTQWRRKKL